MLSSLILTLMELGIFHVGHVLYGISYEESNSSLTNVSHLLKQTVSQKLRKGLCHLVVMGLAGARGCCSLKK